MAKPAYPEAAGVDEHSGEGPSFALRYRFVNNQDGNCGKAGRSHVVNEVVRRRHWKKAQNLGKRNFFESKTSPSEQNSPLYLRRQSHQTQQATDRSLQLMRSESETSWEGSEEDDETKLRWLQQRYIASTKHRIESSSSGDPPSLFSSNADHFAVLPVQDSNNKVYKLLYYWAHGSNAGAVGGSKTYLSYIARASYDEAVNDPAAFHSLLTHAAMYAAQMHGRDGKSDPEAGLHGMQAVKLLNQRWKDPTGHISNGMTMTVVLLVGYEYWWGDQDAAVMHSKGLAQMVEKKGGLQSFKDHKYMKVAVSWVDIVSAGILITKTRFPASQNASRNPVTIVPALFNTSESMISSVGSAYPDSHSPRFMSTNFKDSSDSSETRDLTIHVSRSLEWLCQAIKGISASNRSERSGANVEIAARKISGSLIQMQVPPHGLAAAKSYANVLDTCRLAAITYISTLWQIIHPSPFLPEESLARLESSMLSSERSWTHGNGMLFWLVVTGEGSVVRQDKSADGYEVLEFWIRVEESLRVSLPFGDDMDVSCDVDWASKSIVRDVISRKTEYQKQENKW